ncbi:hypothetical protein [uncultured Oceanicoccus sp.]|uniref:hypothetical protein n=1 Tax=uncultured Oceanicoccus sp. TaxID=1706381 RepID=UPI0030DA902A
MGTSISTTYYPLDHAAVDSFRLRAKRALLKLNIGSAKQNGFELKVALEKLQLLIASEG